MAQKHASLRSVGMLSAFSLAQLVVQFGYQMLMARSFGATAEMDAYTTGLALPTYVSFLVTAAFAHSFLPRFVDRWERDGEDSAWELCTSVFYTMVGGLTLVTLACFVFARPLMNLLVPGLSPAEMNSTSAAGLSTA